MQTVVVITYLIVALVGLLYCFRGERWLRVFMLIYGVALGYSYSMRLMTQMGAGQGAWIIALLIGLAIGLLAFFLLKAAIFLAGGLVGLALFHAFQGTSLLSFAPEGTSASFLVGLAFFLILGAITLAARKVLLRVGTAFYGAYTLVGAVGVLIEMALAPGYAPSASGYDGMGYFSTLPAYVSWLLVLALGLAGIVAQFRGRRGARQ